jgi:large subunit ribosomal protein L30
VSTQLKVTLIKSQAGQLKNIAQSVRGLGLRKIHQSVVVKDTPEIRGLIRTATHLLKVEAAAK